ncbi:alginate lyase 2 [Talaromyces proteolyticus]|uniref:Alginate lyase 2 n=1 Tax=Talaromyces proteolyticus TaxID=1131652 RepID=A0AAD4L2W1_9EURO|nr:alginate lyase 2 [Talaromyces proteolyticus]KAH8703213.1 alginate lyase 2 [Talaromyces proteolyticus]
MHFNTRTALELLPLLQLASAAPQLVTRNSSACAPGFYLPGIANFQLQLPIGSEGHPQTESGSELSGCGGFQDPDWFYWDSNGKYIVMKAPPSSTDCVKTTNSKHCRTEFREEKPDSWSASATNTMTVKVAVAKADDGKYGTVIGQVFSAEYSKPVAELFYKPSGEINIGVEQTTSGGNSDYTSVGNVPEGTTFTYELSYSHDSLTFSLNGGKAQSFATDQLGNPDSYFKFGNYNQGTDAESEVHVYSVDVVHK